MRRFLRAAGLLVLGSAIGFTSFQVWWLEGLLDDLRAPSSARRFHSLPVRLEAGLPIDAAELVRLLRAAGLRADAGGPGTFARDGDGVRLSTRPIDLPPSARVALEVSGGRLRTPTAVTLAPVVIAEEPAGDAFREWVAVEAMPPTLVRLIQAVEDRRFGRHGGVDWRGLLRAFWVNLTRWDLREGGSTITQQLVKSRYLSPERTGWRKYNEMLLAVLLERRYGKAEILEAYLNDVYLGQRGAREVRGFPQAARHYFGRTLDALGVEELALLVGMLRGPSWYHPWRNPERAIARRNRVLRALYQTGHLSRSQLAALEAAPLGVRAAEDVGGGERYPAYLDLVRRQLGRAASAPVEVPTGLNLRIQAAAERSLTRGLGGRDGLQGAVVVANRRSGVIEAAVGGVPVTFPGFNRTIDARRQVGSVIKPVYYWLALERPEFDLLTELDDARIGVPTRQGGTWVPENFDGRDLGPVPLLEALAGSRNRASVRLGLALGLDAVAAGLVRLGIQREPPRHPSVLLGALELSPLEVAQLYLALSRDGRPLPLTAIATGGDGRRELPRTPATFLLSWALVHAVEQGTGRGFAPRAAGELAGKTGTTNDGRDAWFAGWTAEHVLVVWIGRDDSRASGLSGAADAGRVVAALAPALLGGPVAARPPASVSLHPVDLGRARRIDEPCPSADHLPFLDDRLPPRSAPCPD